MGLTQSQPTRPHTVIDAAVPLALPGQVGL